MNDVGIYIKTHRPDYYLAKALIASLDQHASEYPIMVIPDDDYLGNSIWGLPVLQQDDPFLLSLKGYFRKFWVFFGPFKRFLYLDADQLTLKSLDSLMSRITVAREPFILVNFLTNTSKVLKEGTKEEVESLIKKRAGPIDLMRQFDPDFDWKQHYPFCSGDFASHVGFLDSSWFRDLYFSIENFHKKRGLPPLSNSREGLFMADQGLLNYVTHKRGIAPEYVSDFFIWGGKSIDQSEEMLRSSTNQPDECLFVHWAGCPRPTVISRNVPFGREWFACHLRYYFERGQFVRLVIDSITNLTQDLSSKSRLAIAHFLRLIGLRKQ